MLKSILSKIKSEKSQTHSSKEQLPQVKDFAQITKPISSYQFSQLAESNIVQCNILKIRYSVQPSAPAIFNRVLACPISVFNVLPFGKRKVKEIDLRTDPFPEYLSHLSQLLKKELSFFNHLLINVYPPGIGIMPHFDGPLYESKVVVLSLGGPSIISFTQGYGSTNKIASLLLQDQSIHVFQGYAYQRCLHGIADLAIDSIFLKLIVDKVQQKVLITSASVSNFELTRLSEVIKQNMMNNKNKQLEYELDMTQEYGSPCCLIPIHNNQAYNYKVQIGRRERISITIRKKND